MDVMDKIIDYAGKAIKEYGEKAIKSGIEKGIEYGVQKIGLQSQKPQSSKTVKFTPAPSYARDIQTDYTNYLIIGGLIVGAILLLRR